MSERGMCNIYVIDLIKSEGYKLFIDWEGSKYCGITLQCQCDMQILTISVPGYTQENAGKIKT